MEKGKLLKIASLILLTGILTLFIGCASTKVERKAVDTTIDLSGRWNDADSRMVAEEMIRDCLDRPWLEQYRDGHGGKRPTVIVGKVRNRSHEHINVQTFVKDLERALINSGRVLVAAANGLQMTCEMKELRNEDEAYAALCHHECHHFAGFSLFTP